jgi:hypothetical protein
MRRDIVLTALRVEQSTSLDMVCPLKLQQTTACDKRNVHVDSSDTVRFSSDERTDVIACMSNRTHAAASPSIAGETCVVLTGIGLLETDTTVMLHSIRGSNQMRMHADFTPQHKVTTAVSAAKRNVLVPSRSTAGLPIQVLPGPPSGLVQYPAFVDEYFESMPFCNTQPSWPAFAAARTLHVLRQLSPCKTWQRGRDNGVYLHTAELGVAFLEQTVLAFYKTDRGRDRVANMQTQKNLDLVSHVTDASLFDTGNLTEFQLASDDNNNSNSSSSSASQHTPLLVGDLFSYLPPLPPGEYNVSILEPHPVLGRMSLDLNLVYPTTVVVLRFPGVYTIIEDSMQVRRDGSVQPFRAKKYATVRKRVASPDMATRAPLRYITLVDQMPLSPPNINSVQSSHAVLVNVSADSPHTQATHDLQLWGHLSQATSRSCQHWAPELTHILDMQTQYTHLVRLLIREGPCGPGLDGHRRLHDPGDVNATDSECILLSSTRIDTQRDALLAVQRRFTGRDPVDQAALYEYTAQYLTPALLALVFGNMSIPHSFCNVRNRLFAPASLNTAASRVLLWTHSSSS